MPRSDLPGRRWRAIALLALLFSPTAAGASQEVGADASPSAVEASCATVPQGLADGCAIGGELQVPVVGGGIFGGLGGVLGGLGESLADALWAAVVRFVAKGVQTILDGLLALATRTTTIDLTAGWFTGEYQRMITVGAALTLPLLLFAIVRSLFIDRSEMLRAGFVWLPISVAGMFGAVATLQLVVAASDQLAALFQDGLGTSAADFVTTMGAALAPAAEASAVAGGPQGLAVGALAGFGVAALFLGFGSFVLWVELLLREAAVYVAVLFMPLAFAAMVWRPTRHWLRRMTEGVVALLLSKFVIVAILSMASAAMNAIAGQALAASQAVETGTPLPAAVASEDPLQSIGVLLLGGALVLLAVCAPYALFRLIPAFSAQAATALEGVTRRPTSAVPQVHPVHGTYARVAQLRSLAARGGSAGAATVRSSAAAASAGSAAAGTAVAAGGAVAARAARASTGQGEAEVLGSRLTQAVRADESTPATARLPRDNRDGG